MSSGRFFRISGEALDLLARLAAAAGKTPEMVLEELIRRSAETEGLTVPMVPLFPPARLSRSSTTTPPIRSSARSAACRKGRPSSQIRPRRSSSPSPMSAEPGTMSF